MKSKLRGVALLLVAFSLIILSRKDLLADILEEWRLQKKIRQQQSLETLKIHQFEVQKLIYDQPTQRLRNPVVYFQRVRLGEIDFSKYKRKSVKVEDGDQPEVATDSQ